ncbi:MAG: Mitochondrial porin [Heterodermia speciosa]|uniref:Mitochondrial outer membrane protein porin n=1 Tax=Heterodermia speciosa TaxID=116794 RepID=A0A8H3FWG2_9LECA|nr:MAG: Mitochondrial porin [Heterodermia speciosa]
MAVPAFSDIAKASNDILNRDFYHVSAASLDIKSKAPNGVTFNVKGKASHEGKNAGNIEAKYADTLSGLTVTQGWSTANVLDTKIELNEKIAKGLKAEILGQFLPSSQNVVAKLNLHFKQPNFHGRAFVDATNGPTANIDAVIGHEGFVVGVEAGYDVSKAAITRYAAAVGYSMPLYSTAVTASNNLSIFSFSYYHKVNSEVEAGAKASWDSKAGNTVGLEVAGKWRLDPTSFAKAKVNDRGIAALAYNVLLRPGVKVGIGMSFDTQHLKEASHKVGASFEFEG